MVTMGVGDDTKGKLPVREFARPGCISLNPADCSVLKTTFETAAS